MLLLQHPTLRRVGETTLAVVEEINATNRGRGLYQYKNRATSQPHFNQGTGKIFCKSVIEWATQHFNVIIALIMHMHPTMARSQMHYISILPS